MPCPVGSSSALCCACVRLVLFVRAAQHSNQPQGRLARRGRGAHARIDDARIPFPVLPSMVTTVHREEALGPRLLQSPDSALQSRSLRAVGPTGSVSCVRVCICARVAGHVRVYWRLAAGRAGWRASFLPVKATNSSGAWLGAGPALMLPTCSTGVDIRYSDLLRVACTVGWARRSPSCCVDRALVLMLRSG